MHPDIDDHSVDDKRVCESFTWDHWVKLNCEETETKFDVAYHSSVKQVKSHSDKQNWA